MIPVPVFHLCCCHPKAATDNMWTDQCGYILVKLYWWTLKFHIIVISHKYYSEFLSTITDAEIIFTLDTIGRQVMSQIWPLSQFPKPCFGWWFFIHDNFWLILNQLLFLTLQFKSIIKRCLLICRQAFLQKS